MENKQIDQIKQIYNKYFKNSAIIVTQGVLCDNIYFIDCYLSQNEKECINGYFENDIFKIKFKITESDNSFMLENLTKCYMIKPKNEWLYCDYSKISFKRTIGNFEKIAKSFENFIIKLKNNIIEDYQNNNIHKNAKNIIASKIA